MSRETHRPRKVCVIRGRKAEKTEARRKETLKKGLWMKMGTASMISARVSVQMDARNSSKLTPVVDGADTFVPNVESLMPRPRIFQDISRLIEA